MEVTHEEQGDVDVFRISGRLDYSAVAGKLEERLRAPSLANPLRRFPVLDLSGVTMLGSQALRAILALAKELKGQSGIVFVCAPSAAATEALKVSGFLQMKIFESHDTLKDALSAATLAAKNTPVVRHDGDPWQMPVEKPLPPEPLKGWALAGDISKKAAMATVPVIKKTASLTAKTWVWLAEKIQALLDRKARKP